MVPMRGVVKAETSVKAGFVVANRNVVKAAVGGNFVESAQKG